MSFCKYQEQEWVLPLGRNRWFSTSSRILVFLHSIKSNPFFSVEGNIPLKSLVIFSIYGIIKEKKKKKCLLAVISRNILTNKLFDSVLYQRWLNYFSLNFLSSFYPCIEALHFHKNSHRRYKFLLLIIHERMKSEFSFVAQCTYVNIFSRVQIYLIRFVQSLLHKYDIKH